MSPCQSPWRTECWGRANTANNSNSYTSDVVHTHASPPANEPRRPKNGFMRYSVKHRAELSRRYPNKDNRGISKLLGTRWKKMTPEEKSPYEAEFSRDIHRIRTQHPLWRYAPLRKSALDLAEPMTTRLRPRDKIRSRFQDGNNSEWDWDLPSRPASQADGSTSPLQHSATSWKQCDVCHLWRPLPGHVDAEDFPQTWNCFMNPDPRFNMCGRLPSLPGAPPTECFPLPSFLQPLEPAQLQVSVSGQSVVGSVCVGIPPPPPQPPLFIVCSVPTLFTPVSNITHTVLVSQASAAV
ncbi:uncharacterized protein LOC143300808 [Babylonia areolata]|uniref:uncharacterized protein LOC143300808 n=1 Tax=Babylonia areolata TaxID=304850 RepID=UPI003FCFE519